MAQERKAEKVVQALLEGTVIIFNGGEGEAGATQVIKNQGADAPEPKRKAAPVRDEFDVPRKSGKRWHFKIRRNEFGQISDIEVDET